ncbi:MAG: N-acetylneuraminate synthase [Alphaproteobacteria bacterium]|nr:N-acetylneuraminate synthase [Alphaproteobacteria bacterium]
MTVVIAEAGVNHNGDVGRAREMIAAAANAGADIVKFQAFSAKSLVARGTSTAAYQNANTGETDQIALLNSLELRLLDFRGLACTCRDYGVGFLCTVFDVEWLEPLIDEGMRLIKIPSGELTNLPMLRRAGALGVPVALSTGMGTLEEVQKAVLALKTAGASEITVLHCTSLYPAPVDAVNLRAMTTMRDSLRLPVGYSDHSVGDHIAIAAVALGAVMIEKHFTLDRRLPGPDHRASLEPSELKSMIEKIRAVEAALGDGVKQPVAAEIETARLVRRSWHAARPLEAGKVLTPADVVLKRPATGLAPDVDPVGRRLRRSRDVDQPILAEDIA